ncbi:Imm9 family immunity protein [Flavobacterium johnsoniae]|uniref:Imm9 family immunity protein n=1 Tax=Flavobacterium johnsoniae TaxID=986 RepID=UPI0011EC79EE|nr:Imm9 family immunity protein [Flavobacterium johnsoniae]
MKLKVVISPAIIDFPNLHNERLLLEKRINEIANEYKFINELPEWTIEFYILLGKGNWNGIYKKGTTTSSLSIRSHSIFLSVPFSKEIVWGINEKKFAPRPELNQSKFKIISSNNWNLYDNLNDYIIEESFLLIIDLLKSGIKFKNIDVQI